MIQPLTFLLQWGPHGPHAPQGPHGPMGPHWGGAWGPGTGGGVVGFGGPGALLLILALVALVVGIYLLFRFVTERAGEDDALAVLERRYARGEVDDEEFATRRARLADDP